MRLRLRARGRMERQMYFRLTMMAVFQVSWAIKGFEVPKIASLTHCDPADRGGP